MAISGLYPLLVERKHVYRMWGGHRIADWLNLPGLHPNNIGETWEVYDSNQIRNGILAGQTLAQATQRHKGHLVGKRVVAHYGIDFPLLLKFIDANEKLSIQVHPDDAYAHRYEAGTGFYGKTESWYIIDAQSGADVIHGFKELMSRESFVAAVKDGVLEHLVQHIPVRAGDVIFTPPGTLHAINAGILLFEIQQKSDLTYRVYDYGRHDPATGRQRALHIDKAMDVLRYEPVPIPRTEPVELEPGQNRTLLVACKHFALERWSLSDARSLMTDLGSMEIYTVIEGSVHLRWSEGQLDISTGESVILPAVLGEYLLAPITPLCRMLRVYVPDVERDILLPLHHRGLSKARIERVLFPV